MLALVILFGMIFVGAAAVILTGGYLLDSVQEDSQHQLAQDTADQTHQRIFEAAASGEARQLPDGEVVDSGSITLAMTNGTDECQSVATDLGAIEFDAGDRQVIYEGGAIWERTESGYAIRRAPGINYSDGRSKISLTVIEGASRNDDGQLVADPNETRTRQINRELSQMILDCRLEDDGYRDLNVTVRSEHVEIWRQYFEEHVAAGNADVDVRPTGGDDQATLFIEDLSDPIDYEEWLVVHEWDRGAEDARIENGNEGLNVSVRVRNTGPVATNGTVTLDVHGGPETSEPVTDLGRGELRWVDLRLTPTQLSTSLTPGNVYDYDVNVTPTAHDQWTYEGDNSSVSHSFYFGEPSDVFEVMNVGHTTTDTTVEIEGLIGNIGTEQGEQDVELSLYHAPTDQEVPVADPTIETNLSANATGTVSWTLNRTTIAGGTYVYNISSDDDYETGTFDVSTFEGGDGSVRTGTVGMGTITVLGTEVSAESLESVHVPDSEKEDATLERVDRGMFMPTLVAERDYYGAPWEPVERPGGGWVPAERIDGDLQPMDASPDCGSSRPTYYQNPNSWRGWQVDDCWDKPDGFVWSDDGGYELEWAIAGTTSKGGGYRPPTVSRENTNWAFGEDADLVYDKDWAPISAEIVVEKNGDEERYHRWDPGNTAEDQNLNTYDTQEREWSQEIGLEPGERLTVAATSWYCHDYDHERTRHDELGHEWNDFDCNNPGSYSYYGYPHTVDASGDSDESGVRVLTDGDEVPVLRAGYPDQRNATEVLNDGAAHRINASTGELELGPNEAVFLIELTDRSPDWEEAQTQDSYGDPNYNDVIVLFEYEAVVQTVEVDATNSPEDNDGFDPGTPGDGVSNSGTGGEGSNIETDVTHVVIG